jgi:hypothetical protein
MDRREVSEASSCGQVDGRVCEPFGGARIPLTSDEDEEEEREEGEALGLVHQGTDHTPKLLNHLIATKKVARFHIRANGGHTVCEGIAQRSTILVLRCPRHVPG